MPEMPTLEMVVEVVKILISVFVIFDLIQGINVYILMSNKNK